MAENLVHELRAWLRLAGVQDHGGKSLNGARELFWLAQDSGLDAYGVRMARRLFQRLDFPVADGDMWRRLGNHVDSLPHPASTHEFLSKVANVAPTWLSKGPLASAGKFELFYRMTRLGCDWPQRGDALDRGMVVEIKGQNGLLTHSTMTGLSHHNHALTAFGTYGFVPNATRDRKGSVPMSFEVIKPFVQDHYAKQFRQRHLAANEALARYLILMDLCESCCSLDRAHHILQEGPEFGDSLRRTWLEAIYDENRNSEKALDRLVIFGDGSNVKVVDRREDLAKLRITGVGLRTGRPDKLSLRVN